MHVKLSQQTIKEISFLSPANSICTKILAIEMSEQVLSCILLHWMRIFLKIHPNRKGERGERRPTDKTFKDWIDI